MSDYVQNETEDEISLIELFAVLLKFRKLIVIGTAVVTFLAGTYLFVLPKIIPALSKDKVTVTYNIRVKPLSARLSGGLSTIGSDINIHGSLVSSFKNLPVVAVKYKDYPFLGSDYPENPDMYNMFINRKFDDESKLISVKGSLIPHTYEVSIKLLRENLDYAESFVKEMVKLTDQSLTGRIAEALPLLQANTEESIRRIDSSNAQINDISTIQYLHDLLFEINKYEKQKDKSLLEFQTDKFVIGTAKGRVKKLIISMFASFFCFVFIAFVKAGINSVMTNPSSKKIIVDAWEEGK